jgi:transposase-like protein
MVTLYRYPREHWVHIRTVNVVESPFAALRLRTDAAQRFKRCDRATAVIWKMLLVAERRFRRLNAPHLLAKVYAGVRYVDEVEATQEVAA